MLQVADVVAAQTGGFRPAKRGRSAVYGSKGVPQ